MTENVFEIIENIVPELLPDCDIRRLPAVCSPAEFRQKLKSADDDSIIILTDHILSQKNEFLQGISNIMVSELAARIKRAKTIYAIMDRTLKKNYPNVTTGNAVIFFDKTRADEYVSNYNKKYGNKVEKLKFEKNEISQFFMTMTRFGIEFVEIEPTLCKIRYKQNQLFKTEFDSVSDPNVNFTMLRFLQLQERKEEPEVLLPLQQIMLDALKNSTLACMGITFGGNFEALLITDGRDGSKWIPCFTDTTEIQETYTEIPTIAKLLMTSQVMTVAFTELEKFMFLDNVAGVVVNIGGFGMRFDKQTCQNMIKSAKKNKNRKGDTT